MTFLIQNAKFKVQNDKKPERNIELRSGFFKEISESGEISLSSLNLILNSAL